MHEYSLFSKAWFPYIIIVRVVPVALVFSDILLKRSWRPGQPLHVCGFHIVVRVARHAFVWWKSWSVLNQADNNLLARTRFLFYKNNFIRTTRLKFAQKLRTSYLEQSRLGFGGKCNLKFLLKNTFIAGFSAVRNTWWAREKRRNCAARVLWHCRSVYTAINKNIL